jgi:NAD(P)-dependent dehydrogenase (short-subunit alcohol dehydrogenase family)
VIGVDSVPLSSASVLYVNEADEHVSKRARTLGHDTATRARFRFVEADITDPVALDSGLQTSLGDLAQDEIHVVVNNAGIADPYMKPAPAAQRLASFNRMLAVNLGGAFAVTEACRPWFPLSRQEPPALPRSSRLLASVVHISSTRARQSEPDSEAYASAKAGMLGLTHAQSVSLAGVARVNAVLPGWIDTAEQADADGTGTDEAGASSAAPDAAGADGACGVARYSADVRPVDHEWHGTQRVGVPDDVAQMVAFLADPDAAGFVTGAEFAIDGGVSRKMVYPDD